MGQYQPHRLQKLKQETKEVINPRGGNTASLNWWAKWPGGQCEQGSVRPQKTCP